MIMSLIHPTPKPTMDALQSRHNERLASTGAEALNTRKRKYMKKIMEKKLFYFVRTIAVTT